MFTFAGSLSLQSPNTVYNTSNGLLWVPEKPPAPNLDKRLTQRKNDLNPNPWHSRVV